MSFLPSSYDPVVYMNEQKKKIIQYLVDVNESLSCSVDDLIQARIFTNSYDVHTFVERIEDGKNFCILKKYDQNKEHLFFIPISKCTYDKLDSKCTDKNCLKYHLDDICYYYIYEDCKYGFKCNKSHDINRNLSCFYNRKLNSNLIDNLTLVKLIRLSEKQSIKICPYSNFEYCDGSCDSLHCCKYHLTGRKCKNTASTCAHGHSLDKNSKYLEHNKKVLKSRNLDLISELELRNYIHDAYNGIKNKCKSTVEFLLNKNENIQNSHSWNQMSLNSYEMSPECAICKGKNFKLFNLIYCSCNYCTNCLNKLKQTKNIKCLNKECIYSIVNLNENIFKLKI